MIDREIQRKRKTEQEKDRERERQRKRDTKTIFACCRDKESVQEREKDVARYAYLRRITNTDIMATILACCEDSGYSNSSHT